MFIHEMATVIVLHSLHIFPLLKMFSTMIPYNCKFHLRSTLVGIKKFLVYHSDLHQNMTWICLTAKIIILMVLNMYACI